MCMLSNKIKWCYVEEYGITMVLKKTFHEYIYNTNTKTFHVVFLYIFLILPHKKETTEKS